MIKNILDSLDTNKLNNRQKVLRALLLRDDWTARTTLKVPNVRSRISELRQDKYGGFNIKCINAKQLQSYKRVRPSKLTKQQTYYQIETSRIKKEQLLAAFSPAI